MPDGTLQLLAIQHEVCQCHAGHGRLAEAALASCYSCHDLPCNSSIVGERAAKLPKSWSEDIN